MTPIQHAVASSRPSSWPAATRLPALARRLALRPLTMLLIMVAMALGASEDGEAVRAHLIAQAASGLPRPVSVTIVGTAYRDTTVLGADAASLRLRADGVNATLPWKLIDDRALYDLMRQLALQAPPAPLAAWLRIGAAQGRERDAEWGQALAALRAKDAAAADGVRAPTARTGAQEPPETPAAEGAEGDAATAGGVEGAGGVDAPAPSSASQWDKPLFDKGGKIQRTALLRTLAGQEPRDIERRLGPDAAFFARQGSRSAPERDEVHQRHADGVYLHKTKSSDAVDWTGMAGQVLFVPADPKQAGLDRVRFCWSSHENHAGAKLWHEYLLAPTMKEWYCKSPDPGMLRDDWRQASGGSFARPIALARSRVSWSNCAIMVFANGLVGASGYGNNDDRYPFTMLPPGKVPTAVALTPNNEFALVTVIDSRTLGAQLAVIALEARALAHHSWWYAGMPNAGTYTRLKVVGLIDLPESLRAPSGIATTSDVARWRWPSAIAAERLDQAAVRERWAKGGDGDHLAASMGTALVVSRAESKACLIDLAPLYQAFRRTCFGEGWTDTRDEGPGPGQWPFTFEKLPAAKPRVVKTMPLPQPTAVAAGYADPAAMKDLYFVGTMDGRLLVLSAAGELKVKATLPIGRNPTCISLGRHTSERERLFIACRGDAEVVVVDRVASAPVIRLRLRDRRLVDPVWVEPWDTRGAEGFTVADHAGGALRNYLYSPINAWGDLLFGSGLGPSGTSPVEHTGSMAVPGRPYVLSSAEVN